jgi:uncharacterized protein YbcI
MTDGTDGTPRPFGHQDRLGLELQEITNARGGCTSSCSVVGRPRLAATTAAVTPLIATLDISLIAAEQHDRPAAHQLVRKTRTWLWHASERNFVETIEPITGRTVRAFVSATDTHKDGAAEVFYLEPVATAEATKSY